MLRSTRPILDTYNMYKFTHYVNDARAAFFLRNLYRTAVIVNKDITIINKLIYV